MERLTKAGDPWPLLQRLSEAHRTAETFEELARELLRLAMEHVGATQGQLLLASDLRSVASVPATLGEHFSLGIALDAIADQTVQWDELLDDETACCVPLMGRDGPLALMMVGWRAERSVVEARLASLEPQAGFMAIALSERMGWDRVVECEAQIRELGSRYDDAMQRAVTDGLTGLVNHAHFKEQFALELGRSKRYGNALTLLMVDIDYFKRVNDNFGHLTGDVVIRRIAQALKSQVRDCDMVARYGGEEFAIMLPQTDLKGALVVAERIRTRIRDMVFTTEDKVPIPPVTVSIGVGQLRGTDSLTGFIERADQALYQAKRGGRNRVVLEDHTVQGEDQPSQHSQRQALAQSQRAAFLSAIAEVATEVALKDQYRSDYAEQLTVLARRLGETVGLSPNQQQDLVLAAGLHHIGKIALPSAVLAKADALDDKEWELVKAHPQLAQQLIGQIAGMGSVSEAILYHHERWDGGGYPYGLQGEQIPLVSRVLSLIDCYVAMLHDRPYREAMSEPAARDAIRAGRGSQFDPAIVDAFLDMLPALAEDRSSA